MILFTQNQGSAVGEGIAFGRGGAVVLTYHIGPLDANGGVIPGQAALVAGVVEVRDFIAEFGGFRQHQKAVGEAFGDVKLLFVFLRQFHAVPFAIGFGTGTQIHGHIEYTAFDGPNQFALGEFLLEVQTAEYAIAIYDYVRD